MPLPATESAPDTLRCFHCGEPVPHSVQLAVTIEGSPRPMCCAGCKAAAEFIRDAGLADYYRFRDAPAPKPDSGAADSWSSYDRAELQQRFVTRRDGQASVNLLLEGLRCAACGWLVERRLERDPGVARISVNPATGRATLEWHTESAQLSTLLRTIHALGYRPHVLGSADSLEAALRERRLALKRLAVAGLGMMQVLMFAVALYGGAFDGMDPVMKRFLRLVSMLVATPVLLYAGRPFLEGAWRALAERQLGMDVPVALALLLAWTASTVNTFAGSGQIYFESVTMFTFLLLVGRFAEMSARHRAGSTSEALLKLQPTGARRLRGQQADSVTVDELQVGDVVLVAAGEAFPADGRLLDTPTSVDESLLTGESVALHRSPGDAVLGGSVNSGQPAKVEITAVGNGTVLSGIVRLLERAQTERPAIARLADRWASWFVAVVLLFAVAVALAWLAVEPGRAFESTLAVLVVTCPCALSLATPAAMTAATSALAVRGLLVTRADALESLARVQRIMLDKTGTLTTGHPTLQACDPLGTLPAEACGLLAAGLEQASAHPIAAAFAAWPGSPPAFLQLHSEAGAGIEGVLDGSRYRIGTREFVAAIAGPGGKDDAAVYLGRDHEWLARFLVEDTLRPEAPAVVAELDALGLAVEIVSGDHQQAVARTASATGIADFHWRQHPQDKLALLRRAQDAGLRVAMIGDGINDAPVLAAASMSIAMGSGAALAQTSADAILMRHGLDPLPGAIRLARRTLGVIRQNLVWAVTYNLVALPLAAAGLVPPWAAAIGMSASSLLVVANALRLRHVRRTSDQVSTPGLSAPAGAG